jgi:predicted nucleic acid-binding Zn finger protein
MKKMNMKQGTVVALIPSETSTRAYEIRQLEKNCYACSCLAYRFTKGEVGWKPPCKHMRALLIEKNAPAAVILRADLL